MGEPSYRLYISILIVFISFYLYKELNPIEIDAVITYVNDKDPYWIKQRNNTLGGNGDSVNSHKSWRWNDGNELIHCIRCINKNAKFFRQIILVVSSDSQIDITKIESRIPIRKVLHSEFFEDQKNTLPTFNSMAIEANIHRIQGLSEYYVYFNDDFFIHRPVDKSYFINYFTNRIKIYIEKYGKTPKGEPTKEEIGFFSAWKNTNKILDTVLDEDRNILKHVPQMQVKSVHKKLRKIFSEQFEKTTRSRFRGTDCILISAGLAEYYSLYTRIGEVAYDYGPIYKQVFISDDAEKNKKIYDILQNNSYTFINLQNNIEGSKVESEKLRNYLTHY